MAVVSAHKRFLFFSLHRKEALNMKSEIIVPLKLQYQLLLSAAKFQTPQHPKIIVSRW